MNPKINIRPTSSVYGTYKRLSYEPWTAIAEFVDNSTQSFFDYEEKLYSLSNFNRLVVDIRYEEGPDGDVLIIRDNAYGMEITEFERAIVLDRPPRNKDGRNEFGMGLKTASCWFGELWTVTSTQLGSEYGYRARIDVEKLSKDKDEEIDLDIFQSKIDEHFTEIRIERLNKKIKGARTIGKVRELLSSIYRQDIRSGKIEIIYNGNVLNFKDPDVFEEKNQFGEVERWKKEILFEIEHNGQVLDVKGFVAIRIPANIRDAGFTLLRRGRVIVGGPDLNYRPHELFGDQKTYAYQRLFGELHMDNWPVTQAKDNFDWHSDGLEEKFINCVKEYTKEYRDKSEAIRVRQKIEPEKTIKQAVEPLIESGVIENVSISVSTEGQTSITNENSEINTETDDFETLENASSFDTSTLLARNEECILAFIYKKEEYEFKLIYDDSSDYLNWLIVNHVGLNYFELKINMRHGFFKPFIDKPDFLTLMTKFVVALVLAEISAIKLSDDDLKIHPQDIRINMNEILESVANKGVTI